MLTFLLHTAKSNFKCTNITIYVKGRDFQEARSGVNFFLTLLFETQCMNWTKNLLTFLLHTTKLNILI